MQEVPCNPHARHAGRGVSQRLPTITDYAFTGWSIALSGRIRLAVPPLLQSRAVLPRIAGLVIPVDDPRGTKGRLLWGIVATMPLVAAFCTMVFKS